MTKEYKRKQDDRVYTAETTCWLSKGRDAVVKEPRGEAAGGTLLQTVVQLDGDVKQALPTAFHYLVDTNKDNRRDPQSHICSSLHLILLCCGARLNPNELVKNNDVNRGRDTRGLVVVLTYGRVL